MGEIIADAEVYFIRNAKEQRLQKECLCISPLEMPPAEPA